GHTGITGQKTTNRSSSTTWYASYQLTLPGAYRGASSTTSPTRNGSLSRDTNIPCSSSNRRLLSSWPMMVDSAGAPSDLLPASTMTRSCGRLITVVATVRAFSKSPTMAPWKLSMTTYDPAWLSVRL